MCVFSFCLLGVLFFSIIISIIFTYFLLFIYFFIFSSSNSSDLLYTHLCTQFMCFIL